MNYWPNLLSVPCTCLTYEAWIFLPKEKKTSKILNFRTHCHLPFFISAFSVKWMDMAEDNMEIGTHCYTSPPNRQGLCLRENRVLKIKNKQEQEQKCQGPSAESREQNPLFKRLVHQRSAEMRCTIKSFLSLCECFIFAVAFCVHKSLWMQNAALTHSVATSVINKRFIHSFIQLSSLPQFPPKLLCKYTSI